MIRETDASLEVSRSGLDGPFEALIAKDDVRTALGLEGGATIELIDIEDDEEGSWVLLVSHDLDDFMLVQSHDGSPLRNLGPLGNLGCFDSERHDGCEILGFYRSAGVNRSGHGQRRLL